MLGTMMIVRMAVVMIFYDDDHCDDDDDDGGDGEREHHDRPRILDHTLREPPQSKHVSNFTNKIRRTT